MPTPYSEYDLDQVKAAGILLCKRSIFVLNGSVNRPEVIVVTFLECVVQCKQEYSCYFLYS